MSLTGGLRVAVLVATLIGAAAVAGTSGATRKGLTVYAVPTSAQFMNHADDRIRGMSNNPFDVDTNAIVLSVKGKEQGNGPFPGDDVLYGFDLVSGPNQAKKVGTAMFTCYFTFGKRAICDSYFQLKGGILVASGQFVFASKHFTLSVSGGTDSYLGARGEVQAVSRGKKEQLRFVLT